MNNSSKVVSILLFFYFRWCFFWFAAATKRARQEMLLREGPRFRHSILAILDTTDVLSAILRIQYNSVLYATGPDAQKLNRSARLSRQGLIRLGMEFLHGWAACSPAVFGAFSRHPFLPQWLRRLALESVDSAITLETCLFIERMCRLEPEYELGCALLVPLVALMPVAEGIKCLRNAGREDKSPLRPSPRFFYESISKLLDIIPGKHVVEKVDLELLCEQLANSLESRPIYEPRHGNAEDDGLIGLLKVASQVGRRRRVFPLFTRNFGAFLRIFQRNWMKSTKRSFQCHHIAIPYAIFWISYRTIGRLFDW